MKKLVVLFVIALFAIISYTACGKKYTELLVTVIAQPVGGENVSNIECTIVGQLVNGDLPIQVGIEWWWEDSTGQDDQSVFYDTWTFRSETQEEVNIYISAPSGYVLIGYFWLKVTWENEDGTDCVVESDKALCY